MGRQLWVISFASSVGYTFVLDTSVYRIHSRMLLAMSRARTRPTREETRDRLLGAAAEVFSDKGIGSTSIEDICDAAGYSRGAFYSNFSTKDDLVIELLDVHLESTTAAINKLYADSETPSDFINNMESEQRDRTGPLDIEDGGILYVELVLFALRNPENRPNLVDHHRKLRSSNTEVIEQIVGALGREYPVPTDDLVSLVMALDVGLNLNQLIDPDSYRPSQFTEFMNLLHRLWLSAPPDALDDLAD